MTATPTTAPTAEVILREIHDQLTYPGGNDDRVIDDPAWVSALTDMPCEGEPLLRGGCLVETRSQHLGDGRTLYAVVTRNELAIRRVTAHTNIWAMFAARSRIDEQIFDRPRGARIRSMNAVDLLHRTVVNEHGAEFRVGGLTFDASTGAVLIELLDLDEDGEPIPGSERGVASLEGWEIY